MKYEKQIENKSGDQGRRVSLSTYSFGETDYIRLLSASLNLALQMV